MLVGCFLRKLSVALCFLPLFAGLAACERDGLKSDSGVYRIIVVSRDNEISTGTGFLVSGGTVVATNYHVVDPALRGDGALIGRIYIATLPENKAGDGKQERKPELIRAQLGRFKKEKDLALITADKILRDAPLSLSDVPPDAGAEVKALGFPGAADIGFRKQLRAAAEQAAKNAVVAKLTEDDALRSVLEALDSKMRSLFETDPALYVATPTDGKVSRMTPFDGTAMIQHQAAISEGNSGGPLFDACRVVTGINTLKSAEAAFYYAVPAAELIELLAVDNRNPKVRKGGCQYANVQTYLPFVFIGVLALMMLIAGLFLFRRSSPGRRSATTMLGGRAKPVPRTSYLTTSPPPPSRGGGVGGADQTVLPGAKTRTGGSEQSAAPAPVSAERHEEGLRLVPVAGGRAIPVAVSKLKSGAIVGRDRGCDVVIDDPSISKRHARLILERGGRIEVEDLKSSNGTFRGKSKVGREVFERGETIRFGSVSYTLDVPGAAGGSGGTRLDAFREQSVLQPDAGRDVPSGRPSAGSGAPELVLSGFDENGTKVRLPLRPPANGADAEWTIGRKADRADLVIAHSTISSEHARIRYSAKNGHAICDLGSSNGTKVDGQLVGGNFVPIDRAKQVTLGGCHLDVSRG